MRRVGQALTFVVLVVGIALVVWGSQAAFHTQQNSADRTLAAVLFILGLIVSGVTLAVLLEQRDARRRGQR